MDVNGWRAREGYLFVESPFLGSFVLVIFVERPVALACCQCLPPLQPFSAVILEALSRAIDNPLPFSALFSIHFFAASYKLSSAPWSPSPSPSPSSCSAGMQRSAPATMVSRGASLSSAKRPRTRSSLVVWEGR